MAITPESTGVLAAAVSSLRCGDFSNVESFWRELIDIRDGLLRSRTEAQEADFLLCLCLLSEIADYRNDFETARQTIQEAAESLLSTSWENESGKRLFCQRVWLLVHWAHSRYRFGEYKDAAEILEKCIGYLDAAFAVAEFRKAFREDGPMDRITLENLRARDPKFGLRSRIAYSLGRIARQSGDFTRARDLYAAAMNFQYRRLEIKKCVELELRKGEGQPNPDSWLSVEQVCTNYAVAKSLSFGLSWISLKSGELRRAHASLAASRALFQTLRDPVHAGYTSMLYAQALREQAQGTSREEDLNEASRILTGLLAGDGPFAESPSYQARARLELSSTWYFLQRFELSKEPARRESAAEFAERALSEIRDGLRIGGKRGIALARQKPRRWIFKAAILASRIFRGAAAAAPDEIRRYELLRKARRHARYAVAFYKGPEVSIQDGSKIALAEVHIDLGQKSDYEEAERLLREVTRSKGSNRLDVGICNLHLARIAVRREKRDLAVQCFNEWEKYRPDIQNGFAHDLAEQVYQEVFVGKNFVLSASAENPITYDEAHDALRRWLLQQAHQRLGERFVRDAWGELGISRGTFFNWREKLNQYPPE